MIYELIGEIKENFFTVFGIAFLNCCSINILNSDTLFMNQLKQVIDRVISLKGNSFFISLIDYHCCN